MTDCFRFFFPVLLLGTINAQQPVYNYLVPAASNEMASRPRSILYFSQQNNGHHNPAAFLEGVRRSFGERGIQFTNSTQISSLTAANLSSFDGIFFFGNFYAFPEQTQTDIIDFTNNGGGITAMHVASYSFRNLPRLRNLIGGAFRGHHSIREFTPELIQSAEQYPLNFHLSTGYPDFPEGENYLSDPNHPILNGLESYTSFDEPYLHQLMSTDITVLSYREDHGGSAEPYTWVRTEGAGRVFYHANGHDARTWDQENFRELMIRGTQWTSNGQNEDRFATFGAPIISAEGQLQYFARLDTQPDLIATLYSAGVQSSRESLSAPGNEELITLEPFPAMNHAMANDNLIAMTPRIMGPGIPASARALLIGPGLYPHLVAYPGGFADDLEAGFVFSEGQEFPFQLSLSGDALFYAQIEDSAGLNQKSAFVVSNGASLTPLLLQTNPFPIFPEETVTSISPEPFSFSAEGTAAVLAGNSSTPAEEHLLIGGSASLASWLTLPSQDDSLPSDTTLTALQSLSPVNNNTLIFLGQLEGDAPLPLEADVDQIIASVDDSGNMNLLFREGSMVSGEEIVFPNGSIKSVHSSNRSLFEITVESDLAILACSPSQSPAVLVRVGDPIYIGETAWNIDSLKIDQMMASDYHLLVPAVISRNDAPATTTNALIHHNGIDSRVILQEGWTVPTSSGSLEVSTITTSSGGHSTSGINESASAAILATDTDGTQAIVVYENLDDLNDNSVSDLMELAFGGDPSLPLQNTLPGLPSVTHSGESEVTLGYWHLSNPRSTIEYRAETSTDLIHWADIPDPFVPDPDQSGVNPRYERRILTFPTDGRPSFYRIRLK